MRRFLGWESTERHEHFDTEGNPTGVTIVTRESEWDDEARMQAFEAWEYERLTRRCGHHPATAFDATHGRLVEHQRLVCEDCRAVEQAREKWHKEQGHPDKGGCPCDDETFWIAERVEF